MDRALFTLYLWGAVAVTTSVAVFLGLGLVADWLIDKFEDWLLRRMRIDPLERLTDDPDDE